MDVRSRCARPPAGHRQAGESRLVAGVLLAALLGLLPVLAFAGGLLPQATASSGASAPSPATIPADSTDGFVAATALEREQASADVRHVAGWVATTGDNQAMPYVIVDKVNARVYVFDAGGGLQASAAALLGMERGDGSVDGLGKRALAAIGPEQRTTPAGRFVASLGLDLKGQDILWVDYETSLALHRVVKGTPSERRAQRLQSPAADDNRISYGCINVPVPFFEAFVSPAFKRSSGVVYILPEMSPAQDLFKARVADAMPGAP